MPNSNRDSSLRASIPFERRPMSHVAIPWRKTPFKEIGNEGEQAYFRRLN